MTQVREHFLNLAGQEPEKPKVYTSSELAVPITPVVATPALPRTGLPRDVFCKDCKHARKSTHADGSPSDGTQAFQWTCWRNSADAPIEPDYLVLGTGPRKKMPYCNVQRCGIGSDINCGREGAWFEPKDGEAA